MRGRMPAILTEEQRAFRDKRVEICGQLFVAYAFVDEARRNTWVRDYCEAQLAINGDDILLAVNEGLGNPRLSYSKRGLFDLTAGALPMTVEEAEVVEFVENAVELTKARDAACRPLAAAILHRGEQ